MKPRQLVRDTVIVIVALGFLAAPYLLPERQPQLARPIKGTVSTSAPRFACETNAGIVYTTVTLTVSNSYPFDIQWYVDWFECRPANEIGLLEAPVGLTFQTNVLRSDATGQMTILVYGRTNTDHVCGYSIHWAGRAGGLIRALEGPAPLKRLLRNNPILAPIDLKLRRAEFAQGWSFGSNLGTENYFRRVHGLDEDRWARVTAEEERHNSALNEAGKASLRLRWFRQPTDTDATVKRADQAWQAAVAESQHTLIPPQARRAYHIWSAQQAGENADRWR